jgi:hypothetical protein
MKIYCLIKIYLYVILIFGSVAQAQTFVQINGLSLHDRSGYNGFNYGAGVEHTVTKDWTMAAGWYYNSERRGSGYTYGRYAVYKQDSWDIGIAVGAVTGYQRAAVVPMIFPEVCYGWVCGLFAPRVENTGANVVAFRLRIPVN